MTERGGRIALAAGACLVGLLVCEFLLDFVMPRKPPPARVLLHRKSAIPGLSYELAPGFKGGSDGVWVATNPQGMRDDEPALGNDVYRIAAVGDSFGFGWGVEVGDSYPALLERLLNESCGGARRFDVLNLCVSGYSTRDEALVVRSRALPFRPRWIVIGYVLNDPLTDPLPAGPLSRSLPPHFLQEHFEPPSLWRRSNLLRLVATAARRLQVLRLGRGDYYNYLHAPGQPPWESVVTGFRDIASDAQQAGARVCLAIFPLLDATRTRVWGEYPYSDLHRQVAAAAAEAGFSVVDLAVPFSRHPPDALRRSNTDHHPTLLAHRLAAEALRDALAPGCAPDAP